MPPDKGAATSTHGSKMQKPGEVRLTGAVTTPAPVVKPAPKPAPEPQKPGNPVRLGKVKIVKPGDQR